MEESLHNTNAAFFKKKIYELSNTKPQEYIAKKLKIDRKLKREAEKNIPFWVKVTEILLIMTTGIFILLINFPVNPCVCPKSFSKFF